jgi:hypothetical protein
MNSAAIHRFGSSVATAGSNKRPRCSGARFPPFNSDFGMRKVPLPSVRKGNPGRERWFPSTYEVGFAFGGSRRMKGKAPRWQRRGQVINLGDTLDFGGSAAKQFGAREIVPLAV